MSLVIPRSLACGLHCRIHGAAMISAIEQEFFQYRSAACNKPGTHAGHIGPFGEAAEYHKPGKAVAAKTMSRFEGAERTGVFVEIDLGITLVRGNDKSVTVGKFE